MTLGETIFGGVVVGIVLFLLGWVIGVPKRIAQWRLSRRVYLPTSVTPELLCGMRRGLTTVAGDRAIHPYLGQWMPPATRILSNLELADGWRYRAIFHDPAALPLESRKASVFMYFSRRKWGRRIHLRPPGSEWTAVGQLQAVGDYWINVKNCELVEDKV